MLDRVRQRASAEGTMAASLVASTVAFAVSMGIPLERVTAATGLTLTDLVDPDARCSNRCAPAVWRLLHDAFPGQAIPLKMADRVPSSCFGPLALAVQHAPTMRAALETFVRYRTILSPELEVTFSVTPAEARIEIAHPADREDHGWGAESALAIGVRFIREVMGISRVLKGVAFVHEPSGPLLEYEQFFGVPVVFNQASNALLLHPALLDAPLAHGDPGWYLSIQSHLDVVREKLSGTVQADGLEKIREAIARCGAKGIYAAEAIARELGLSLRTLQRQALAHNSSVRALIDEARRASSCQLLADALLSVEEVATVVGYSAEGPFRRAFTRWTGVTPAQWRRANTRSTG